LPASLTGGAFTAVFEALAGAAFTAFGDATAFPPVLGDADSGFFFTSCLLAEGPAPESCAAFGAAEALLWGVDRVDSAGECTGFPLGNPISCKSETIISLPYRAHWRLPYRTWPTAG
jgi:hypothetical protein